MGWVSIATNKLTSFVCGHREYSQLIYCRWGKAYNDHLLWASAPYTANACWKCIFFPCWKWMCMFLAYIGNVCAKVQILFAWLSIKETLALLYQTSHPFTTRLIMLQVRMVRLQFYNCVSQTQYSWPWMCNDNSENAEKYRKIVFVPCIVLGFWHQRGKTHALSTIPRGNLQKTCIFPPVLKIPGTNIPINIQKTWIFQSSLQPPKTSKILEQSMFFGCWWPKPW